jgi:hypothetical protein
MEEEEEEELSSGSKKKEPRYECLSEARTSHAHKT